MSKILRLTMALWVVLAPAVGPALPESRRTIPGDPETTRLVRLVDEALDRRDIAAAVRAWHDAYVAARVGRRWEAMIEVGDAYLRIGEVSGIGSAARARARSLYLMALTRAEGQRSIDGVLRVADAFARLGDRDVVANVLRIASRLADRAGDPAASERVERFTRQLSIWTGR